MISFLLQQRIKIDCFEKEAPVNHARGKLNDSIKIKNNFLFYSICTNICQRQIGLLIVLSSYWKPNTKKMYQIKKNVYLAWRYFQEVRKQLHYHYSTVVVSHPYDLFSLNFVHILSICVHIFNFVHILHILSIFFNFVHIFNFVKKSNFTKLEFEQFS